VFVLYVQDLLHPDDIKHLVEFPADTCKAAAFMKAVLPVESEAFFILGDDAG
jgi:hypothetical protein